jgi:hypothetical protein
MIKLDFGVLVIRLLFIEGIGDLLARNASVRIACDDETLT